MLCDYSYVNFNFATLPFPLLFDFFNRLWVIATPVEYTLKALENLTYTLYRSSLYDVEFNLYRGIFHQNQRIIAVSCTPFNPNREKCSNEGHYTLVDSAPSWKRLMDLEPIIVEVKGQYINTETCENILRCGCYHFCVHLFSDYSVSFQKMIYMMIKFSNFLLLIHI